MWAEVSCSVPHLLQSGLSNSPIRWRCLLRVLCPVRRPVSALDCVLLKDRNLSLASRQGHEIDSRACRGVSPRPRHRIQFWLTNRRQILLRISWLKTPKAGSGPTNFRKEPSIASLSAISLPRTPASPEKPICRAVPSPTRTDWIWSRKQCAFSNNRFTRQHEVIYLKTWDFTLRLHGKDQPLNSVYVFKRRLLGMIWSGLNTIIPLRLQASHCSTFRIMCDVPSIVFCSESIECFPGTTSKFFFKLLVTIPVAPIITGTIYISGSTFVLSLYINSCILTSFPLPFVQHFCLRVLPHLSVCMLSFLFFCF